MVDHRSFCISIWLYKEIYCTFSMGGGDNVIMLLYYKQQTKSLVGLKFDKSAKNQFVGRQFGIFI